jgi:hypothetical protein
MIGHNALPVVAIAAARSFTRQVDDIRTEDQQRPKAGGVYPGSFIRHRSTSGIIKLHVKTSKPKTQKRDTTQKYDDLLLCQTHTTPTTSAVPIYSAICPS